MLQHSQDDGGHGKHSNSHTWHNKAETPCISGNICDANTFEFVFPEPDVLNQSLIPWTGACCSRLLEAGGYGTHIVHAHLVP
jgi:hypothetical protein